jgi:hypothetical protein
MLQFPVNMYRDRENNVIGASHLSPTDSVIATLSNKGTRRRLIIEIRTPVALSGTAMLLPIKNSGGGSMMDVEMID